MLPLKKNLQHYFLFVNFCVEMLKVFSLFAFRCFNFLIPSVSQFEFHQLSSWKSFFLQSLQFFQATLLSLITTILRMSHFLHMHMSFRLIQDKSKSGNFCSFTFLLISYQFPWSKASRLFRNHNLVKMRLRRWGAQSCLLHSFF